MVQFLSPLLALLGVSLLGTTTGAASGLRFSVGSARQSSPARAWLAVSVTGFAIALLAIIGMISVFVIGSEHLFELMRGSGPLISLTVTSN